MSALAIVDIALAALVICAVIGAMALLWWKDRELAKEILFVAWIVWLIFGWAPIVMGFGATSHTGQAVDLYALIAYGLSWLLSVSFAQD